MNSVQLIGRLTKDPDMRYTSGSQMAVATFTIAIDRPTKQGEEKKTDFPRITVFGKQAESCEKYLAKGRKVAIEGRIQTGSYQNSEGATVYTTDVIANRVEFLEWGDRQQEHHAGGYSGGYQTPPHSPRPPQPPAYTAPQPYQTQQGYGQQAYAQGVQQQMAMPQAATPQPQGFSGRQYPDPGMPPQFEQIDEDVPF